MKKKKKKKEKKEIVFRTKEERQNEVATIIKQLSEFELNMVYEPIRKLYMIFKKYINEGSREEINIPFPEINRRIKGVLAISVKEEVWVSLRNEKF
tara:strand:+ start:4083 stop:4370 length:288 start_codon:yes stop_codon:yes gene_type:complete